MEFTLSGAKLTPPDPRVGVVAHTDREKFMGTYHCIYANALHSPAHLTREGDPQACVQLFIRRTMPNNVRLSTSLCLVDL
jgi:hypothetical protein